MNTPDFREHDTNLHVWWGDPNDPQRHDVRNSIVKHLRARGFRIGLDLKILKRFGRPFALDYHRGRKGYLEVKVSLSGRHLAMEFFQNLVIQNRNGGEYDFDKRAKMPYLIGKAYEVERRHIAALVEGYSFKPLALDKKVRGLSFIQQRQAEYIAFHGRASFDAPIPDYNSRSATKGTVKDGDTVYFFGNHAEGGRLLRGVAYRNINNMWWVLIAGDECRNLACFELFHRSDFTDLPRKRWPEAEATKRIAHQLKAAIEAERFERAVGLRDALRARQLPKAA